MEVYDVTAVNLFTDESLPVTFSVWDDEEVDISCLKVASSFCSLTASGEHLFEVFKILRDQLLQDGWGLLCYGAAVNAHASPMMSACDKVYMLTPFYQAKMEDVVCLFDFYDVRSFVDSKAQEAFYNVWGEQVRFHKLTPFYHTAHPFSQWHKVSFSDGKYRFSSAEQYMMFQKAILFGDNQTAMQILKTSNPRKQKQLGREIQGFNQSTWDKEKKSIVYKGNYLKFTQNAELLEALLATQGTLLVEASPTDKIWGVGMGLDTPELYIPSKWKGENLLGFILTQLREDILNKRAV